jgi:isochorismate pyruvate lyase
VTECNSLDDVRTNIDALDRQIVALLAERTTYVEAAARFKAQKALVVDPPRIEDVIAKVRHRATEHGMNPDLAETIYRAMIDAYILHEGREWVRVHGD